MSHAVQAVTDTVKNVLDQTLGKLPELDLSELGKVKPLKALGNLVQDSWDWTVNKPRKALEEGDLGMYDKAGKDRDFGALGKKEVEAYKALGGSLAGEDKAKEDLSELVPKTEAYLQNKARVRTEASTTKKGSTSPVWQEWSDKKGFFKSHIVGSEKKKIEGQIQGLQRMYASRQQAVLSGKRRPGQKESLLTRR
jgi:hypothetical protein